VGEGISRIVLALALFGLLLTFLQRGAGGPKAWVRAKFLGKVS
jgi:hypothetical protein